MSFSVNILYMGPARGTVSQLYTCVMGSNSVSTDQMRKIVLAHNSNQVMSVQTQCEERGLLPLSNSVASDQSAQLHSLMRSYTDRLS